jgi:hypothetical protein
VAIGASAGADEGSAWNGGGHHHRTGECGAGEENRG